MITKKYIAILIAVFLFYLAPSLADSIELIASKTEAVVNESVLLVAIAKFDNVNIVRVDSIKIYENNKVIKECKNKGSEAFICYTFVSSNVSTTKTYYAEVVYTIIVDPILRSNVVNITWREDVCQECRRYLVEVNKTLVDIVSLLRLLLNLSYKEISLLEQNLEFVREIRDLVRQILYYQKLSIEKIDKIIEILDNLSSITSRNTNLLVEILNIVRSISETQKLHTEALDRIIAMLNDIMRQNSNNTQLLVEILNIVRSISETQKLHTEALDRIIAMLNDIMRQNSNNTQLLVEILNTLKIVLKNSEITNLRIERVSLMLDIINTKIDRVESSISSELVRIRNELIATLELFKKERSKQYIVDLSSYIEKDKYCLTFESIDNRIIEENKLTILIRNCGEEELYNVTVLVKFKEDLFVRVIPVIYPNEVKGVTYYLGKLVGERNLVSVYAFNNLVNIKYDFYVERYGYLYTLKIDIPKTELIRGKWNEIYITIKNQDNRALRDLEIKVDVPHGITYSLETSRITLTPLQTKSIKMKLFVSEDFSYDKFNLRISVGEKEVIEEFKVISERIEENKVKGEGYLRLIGKIDLTPLVVLILIIIFVALVIVALTYKRVIDYRRTPEGI
ncbi:MAG: hypothetical protein QW367_03140 [Candidatus Aenigmatarchaeota archaeon]